MKDAISYDQETKLWVLPGSINRTRNPAVLIGSERMKGFVDPCKQSSFVVMDAAPVGPVIDSVILSQPVDKVVFVVRWA